MGGAQNADEIVNDRRILRWLSVALVAAALPTLWLQPTTSLRPDLSEIAVAIEHEQDHLLSAELDSMLSTSSLVRIFDLRDSVAYAKGHVPGAIRTTITELLRLSPSRELTTILYSDGGVHAGQAWTLMRAAGHERIFTLLGGWNSWKEHHPDAIKPHPTPASPNNTLRERERLLGEC